MTRSLGYFRPDPTKRGQLQDSRASSQERTISRLESIQQKNIFNTQEHPAKREQFQDSKASNKRTISRLENIQQKNNFKTREHPTREQFQDSRASIQVNSFKTREHRTKRGQDSFKTRREHPTKRGRFEVSTASQFSSVQDGIYALGNADMRSTQSFRSFPNFAFDTVPMFV